MINKLAITISCLVLTACVNVDKTYGPNGEESYSITCSGTAQDWGACLTKAGEICGSNGYNIISANGDKGAMLAANQNMLFGNTAINRNLLISCK